MSRYVTLIIASLLIVCISWGCRTEVQSEVLYWPIEVTEGRHIMVDATISDSVNGRFILDTGGGIHVLSNSILSQISSTPRGLFTGIRHTGEPVDLQTFHIESIDIGGVRQKNPVVATWPTLDSAGIDGILSLKFFEDYPFTLDLKDQVIVFETPDSLAAQVESSKSVPLKISDDRGISLDVFADFQAAEFLRMECIIDTGSPGTVIDARHMAALGVDPDSEDVQKREREDILGTTRTEYLATLPSFSLCDSPKSILENHRTVFKEKMIYDGLVGMDFLIGRSFTFDIPGRQLIFNSGME